MSEDSTAADAVAVVRRYSDSMVGRDFDDLERCGEEVRSAGNGVVLADRLTLGNRSIEPAIAGLRYSMWL
jgi:hypothetical protein